jgi:hypothetical protein
MAYIEVDVDVDDFYDELSRWEKQSLVEMLEKDGFCELKQEDNEFIIKDPNALDEIWIENMKKLFHGRLQLSNEDEETIRKIANKL